MERSTNSPGAEAQPERLASLDVFRGFTMFLLIAEGTGIYSLMTNAMFDGSWVRAIGLQLHHHEWHGLHFWDLIQPFFMFIVGVSLPFAVQARLRKGDSYPRIAAHVLKRALVLLLLGWGLYCIGPGKITFRFQNVLAQLSVTYLLAFVVMNRKWYTQAGFSFALLLGTELLYRFFWVEGYKQPFEPDHNFGAWVDMMIAGELSGGHWVSFNAIPTAAHTIWGVLAGQLLMSQKNAGAKLAILLGAGAAAVAAGYGLDLVTPMIKRIATSSFVVMSGGWCLIGLGISYLIADVFKLRKPLMFLSVVGMNSLFIYLFAELNGTDFLYRIVKPFAPAALSLTKMDDVYSKMIIAGLVWGMLWYMCFWLYRRKVFIKI